MSIALYLSIVMVIGLVWFGALGLKGASGEPVWKAAEDRGLVVATRRAEAESGREWEAIANVRIVEVSARELWADRGYCWVVVCKNHWYHRHPNIFNVHRIPLGETDGISARPALRGRFTACCDECGREYAYQPSEVLRYEMETSGDFRPHPLFRE